jgi:hypothetical protein
MTYEHARQRTAVERLASRTSTVGLDWHRAGPKEIEIGVHAFYRKLCSHPAGLNVGSGHRISADIAFKLTFELPNSHEARRHRERG